MEHGNMSRSEQNRRAAKRYRERHKDEIRARQKEYRAKNREKINKEMREWHATHREEERVKAKEYFARRYKKEKQLIFEHYGGTNPHCECCGETRQEFLTVNHKNGRGNVHRREIGESNLYHWLVKNNYPDGFNILCMNCNWASRITGQCPHFEHVLKLEKVSEDYRGLTYRVILPDNRELMLINTRRGFFRGGHSHSKPEISLLLMGRVRNWKIVNDTEVITEKSAGEFMTNQAGEPHLTLALEDYWLLDWKIDAHIGEWATTNYEPYRVRVRHQIPNANTKDAEH